MDMPTLHPPWLLEHPAWLPFLTPHQMRLPGLSPMPPETWIADGPDTNAQLAERDRLLVERRQDVVASLPEGDTALAETLAVLVDHLRDRAGWQCDADRVRRPDGETLRLDPSDPLGTLCRLVPEDLCLLTRRDGASDYRLVAATLCFPAHWRLREKLGAGLDQIHGPVPHYGSDTAARVNRVFTALRSGVPLMRVNWSVATKPDLFTPDPEPDRVKQIAQGTPLYLRVERQSFLRLPQTGAVVFGIRTALCPVSGLNRAEAQGMLDAMASLSDRARAYKGGDALFVALAERLQTPATGG